ncbi:hypothetical protein EDC01DRAFT_368051 [Geopyxis carbonaria]|nr:hypothetical protein EDC01DRAFT_368051 [Geopyxis carbonaria]
MSGSPFFAAATTTTTTTTQDSAYESFEQRRGAGSGSVLPRLPANKKVKLEPSDPALQNDVRVASWESYNMDSGSKGKKVEERGVQTEVDASVEGSLSSAGRSSSGAAAAGSYLSSTGAHTLRASDAFKMQQAVANGAQEPRLSLESLRQTIAEQFDVEIVLKHREIRLIEQEMAKTQIAIEQLRRANLLPYANSPEAQLSLLSPQSVPYGIPEHAPPPGVVDGPYTRHYRQWLLPHPDFDGASVEPFVQPAIAAPVAGLQHGIVGSGRPQRASAMKVQTKTGEQVCVFRKKNGDVVKLQCNDCHRSNFSSAQGFINHCRIAHQTEFPSHDAAAEACGQPIDEDDQALISPLQRTTLDGPARHTRQTQLSKAPAQIPPPLMMGSRRNSINTKKSTPAYINPYILDPNYAPTKGSPGLGVPGPSDNSAPPAKRKGGARRSSIATPKTPKTKTPSQALKGGVRPPTPPLDFNTPHLEGFLKRKRLDINVQEMVKDVTDNRVDWANMPMDSLSDDESGPVSGLKAGSTNPVLGSTRPVVSNGRYVLPSTATPSGVRPPTPTSQEPLMSGLNEFLPIDSTPSRRPMSGITPLSDLLKKQNGKLQSATDGDVEMADAYDASSSSDEEDGYRSDGDENDDELYSVPPRTQPAVPISNGSNGTINPMMLHMGSVAAAIPPHTTGFGLPSSSTSMAPPAPPTPRSEQINGSSSANILGAVSRAAAMVNVPQEAQLPPKHVRFAVPGIGGDIREGVNGTSG